jgi:hypothetical protein
MMCVLLLLAAGCHQPPVVEPPFSYYHAPGLEWCRVNRVLLLPMENESTFNQAPEQVRRALAEELQAAGRFEVVPAPPDVWAELSGQIRCNGRFNEAVMIEMARCTRADLIVMGTISQYSPYRLPRLGLVLQVISPGDAVIVASVDGLWDSTHQDIAARARAYYREGARGGRTAPFPETLALESPQYFQRFVCHEAVASLLAWPPPPPPPPPQGQEGATGAAGAAGKCAGSAGKCATAPCATCKSATDAGAAKPASPVPPAVAKPGTPATETAKPDAPKPEMTKAADATGPDLAPPGSGKP